MKGHLFILGRTPGLALAELATFYPDIRLIADGVAHSEHEVGPQDCKSLGGTVKIAEVLGTLQTPDAQSCAAFISSKATFGISVYNGPKVPRTTLEEIKKAIHASRFVEPRDGAALTSVVIEKNHIWEEILVNVGDEYVVAHTTQVQPFEAWNKRDYGRPHADPKAGMLPPKVARMAVNCAGTGRGKTLLDPFCGMGTVLSEAHEMGWIALGSDQSSDAVSKSLKNLAWQYPGVSFRVETRDATHVSEAVEALSIDAIVTEPFMGDSGIHRETDRVKNVLKGLEKLYIGCLRDWVNVLKPKGRVVIAFPKYIVRGREYTVKKVIDMCENLGYTTVTGPIEYGRPQAVVRREFYIFQKK